MKFPRRRLVPVAVLPWEDARSRLETEHVDACLCDPARGPVGGVCGGCYGAILTEAERRQLDA